MHVRSSRSACGAFRVSICRLDSCRCRENAGILITIRPHGWARKRDSCEKKNAFVYEFRRHVFERGSAGHAIECKLVSSPLFILLERDKNGNLRATHSGQLQLPAAASA